MLTLKRIDVERLIHSFKTAIAAVAGYLLTRFIGAPADQWIVITILVVMCAQIYVGSVLLKAYLRFLGTLAGCIVAAFAIIALGGTHPVAALTIGVSSFIFSYIATGQENLSYAGTLGAVTTAIIMLGQHPTVLFAIERFLEISIGILIASVVSQFVLPIHARTHLRRTQADTLQKLRDYYIACLVTHDADVKSGYYKDFDDSIVKSMSKQRQLAKEAARERLGTFYDPKHFIQTLHNEKEILRSIDFMHYAFINIQETFPTFKKSPALDSFNETILQSLNTLVRVIETDEPPKEHLHIPTTSALQIELQKETSIQTPEKMVYADGFLFSAEILTRSLTKLARLYRVVTKGP